MTPIYFISTYKPILCGIADYLKFLLKEIPKEKWKVISFDLKSFQDSLGRLTHEKKESPKQVWYGITNRRAPSTSEILKGIKKFNKKKENFVFWIQHTFGIWKDLRGFSRLLRELSKFKIKKIISFHTIHFQSQQTPFGMEKKEYNLLKKVLPWVEAITVFSKGSARVVKKAFPAFKNKVHILQHGIPSYPEIIKMPKKEAKRRIYKFLIEKTDLPRERISELKKENIFLDPNALLIGSSGFISPNKNTEKLFLMRDFLQNIIPEKKIVAIYVGIRREGSKKEINYSQKLHRFHNGRNKYFLETWLPQEMLPIFQRALDINFYWPKKCTQSGILSHILGTGVIIAGRDMEGSGEMLRESGQIAEKNFESLILKTKKIILNPFLLRKIERKAIKYAKKYSWENQALRHYKLAEKIISYPNRNEG